MRVECHARSVRVCGAELADLDSVLLLLLLLLGPPLLNQLQSALAELTEPGQRAAVHPSIHSWRKC